MGQCKKDVTPLLTHRSYVFFALTHRYMDNSQPEMHCIYEILICIEHFAHQPSEHEHGMVPSAVLWIRIKASILIDLVYKRMMATRVIQFLVVSLMCLVDILLAYSIVLHPFYSMSTGLSITGKIKVKVVYRRCETYQLSVIFRWKMRRTEKKPLYIRRNP